MTFAIVGGDARQVKLAQILAEQYTVLAFGLDEMPPVSPVIYTQSLQECVNQTVDCVVLPIPLTTCDGLLNMPLMARALPVEHLLNAMTAGQIIAAGIIPQEFMQAAKAKGVHVSDYAKREELAVTNAVPTAEAALQIAMERMTITIDGCKALVIGYGRIGKILARQLAALGANVSVSARKLSDMTWITVSGFRALHTVQLTPYVGEFDVIFNTVPYAVMDETDIKQTQAPCLLIDLASAPGGIDIDAAKRNGRQCIWALALPGKHSPDTAAWNLSRTLHYIIDEMRVEV
ncbi:MAG: dipicolinate synthase subunit DpsA [Oscillospiraceae bacterium]|nr:dipicolinate synthase subunit DpsA [Oscillospiraceae bacterium]